MPLSVGKSDHSQSDKEYAFLRDVEDLEGLGRALDLSEINLLGQSYGGMIAQAYALKYPQFVKRLILIDTFYSGKMWQANNDNANREIRNQYPEVWEELKELRARGEATMKSIMRLQRTTPIFTLVVTSPLSIFAPTFENWKCRS